MQDRRSPHFHFKAPPSEQKNNFYLQTTRPFHFLEAAPRPREIPQRLQQGVPLRAQIARNQRARARTAAAEQAQAAPEADNEPSDSDDSGDDRLKPNFSGEKIGAKKRAKLEAKADKKLQREAELAHREDKKKRDAIVEEEQQKLQEKERVSCSSYAKKFMFIKYVLFVFLMTVGGKEARRGRTFGTGT